MTETGHSPGLPALRVHIHAGTRGNSMPKLLTKKDADRKFIIPVEDGTVTIRPMADSELGEIRKKYTKQRPSRFGMQEEVDTACIYHERLDRIILDWSGFTDAEGKAIPCTRENKVDLADMNPGLFADILSKSERVLSEAKEEAEKN